MGVEDSPPPNALEGAELLIEHVVKAYEAEQLPSVGRTVHYYGALDLEKARLGTDPDRVSPEAYADYRRTNPRDDVGPFAAWVIDVGPGPTTVTLKITDRQGRDHVRANVEYGDPGWLWPARVG